MVVLPVVGVPLEMGVSEKLGDRHEQNIQYGHPLYFQRKYFQERLQMSVPYIASWLSWIADWGRGPSRLTREFIIRLVAENPLELRVYMLSHQIKEIMLKYV